MGFCAIWNESKFRLEATSRRGNQDQICWPVLDRLWVGENPHFCCDFVMVRVRPVRQIRRVAKACIREIYPQHDVFSEK